MRRCCISGKAVSRFAPGCRGWTRRRSCAGSTLSSRYRQALPATPQANHRFLACDETYVKINGKWVYLYRAIDSTGQTLDFLLNQTRSTRAAKRFLRKALGRPKVTAPRVINVDKNPTYIGAVHDLKQKQLLSKQCKRRANRCMNIIVEQDHRFVKRKIWYSLRQRGIIQQKETA